MKSKQLTVGNETEKQVVEKIFRKYGYFGIIIPKSPQGQPVDIIAAKGIDKKFTDTWLVDAKHVSESCCSFPFDRIEPNQIMSLYYAKEFAKIKNLGFAISFDRDDVGVLFLPYDKFIEMKERGLKSVNMSELEPLYKYLEVS